MREIEVLFCLKYCQHGGACSREPGHEGLHNTKQPSRPDAGYCCDFSDEQSIPKEEADMVVRAGMSLLGLPDFLVDIIIENS